LSEAARFDPKTRRWEALPSLPTPRSSHEVVIVGDKVLVLGGWNMRGRDPSVWADTIEVLDLGAVPLRWRSIPQPFKRRALATAVRGGRVHLVGGFDENDTVINGVEIYDVASNSWSKGPDLPKGSRNGFSPAASTLDDCVYISLGDGGVYRLDDPSAAWEKVATTTPRLAHRMVTDASGRLLLLGGARNGDNLDLIEAVSAPAVPSGPASSSR
jgi:N-acetylneuraminic acid mutarotase